MTIIIISVCAAVLVAAGLVIFFVVRKKRSKVNIFNNVETKVVDGTLHLSDVVEYFKGLQLEQEKHTPFVANALHSNFKGMLKESPVKSFLIFVGVYTKDSDQVMFGRLIATDAIDDELKSILGNKDMVVLN